MRPFATARTIVGFTVGIIALIFNMVVFLAAAFGVAAAFYILIAQTVGGVVIGRVSARSRTSRAANLTWAGCIGIVVGSLPYLLWLAFAFIALHT